MPRDSSANTVERSYSEFRAGIRFAQLSKTTQVR
jgi:uncharacterized membrane protein